MDLGGVQLSTDRRVVFSATGWHNPPNFPAECQTQIGLIPRDVSYDEKSGGLKFTTIPELKGLYVESVEGTSSDGDSIATGSSLHLILNCEIDTLPSSGVVGFDVLATNDAYTRVGYDFATLRTFIDHTMSSTTITSTIIQTSKPSITLLNGENTIKIEVLVDNGMLELFGNDRAVISSFVSEVMADTTNVDPADRLNHLSVTAEGVTCTYEAHNLEL